ncbi:hypothetical protein EDB80DRAFT_783903 [Ilyonectria destructans]|nr:hypothetical protein EDB80DRAFT_783903 [Ilyonectria destructans]
MPRNSNSTKSNSNQFELLNVEDDSTNDNAACGITVANATDTADTADATDVTRTSSSTHGDIIFQLYVPQPIETLPPSSSQQNRLESASCLDVLANAASWSDRIETPFPSSDTTAARNGLRSQSTEGAMLASPCPQHPRNVEEPCRAIDTGSNSPGSSGEVVSYGGNDHTIGDDDTCEAAESQPHYATVSSSSERENTSHFLPERISVPPSPNAHGVVENGPGGVQEDENTSYQEEGGDDGLVSDLESQPGDVFEADSSSELDVSDTRSEMDIHDTGVPSESDLYFAKGFLERNWEHLCDCQEGENVSWGELPGLGLQDMTEYWRNLGVPDAIGPTAPHPGTDENEHIQLDWSSILSGGDSRPSLNMQRSQRITPSIQRTWDVDSVISWASCLSINRGLYVSYHPPTSRNFGSNIHVFHQGKALHLIPHLRLGSGRQSPQFGVYVFFPGISHVCRTTTSITKPFTRLHNGTWLHDRSEADVY